MIDVSASNLNIRLLLSSVINHMELCTLSTILAMIFVDQLQSVTMPHHTSLKHRRVKHMMLFFVL